MAETSDIKWKAHMDRAVTICGTDTELARRMKCSRQWVAKLRDTSERGARKISGEQAILVEEATDRGVTRHDLRPDLFGMMAPANQQGLPS